MRLEQQDSHAEGPRCAREPDAPLNSCAVLPSRRADCSSRALRVRPARVAAGALRQQQNARDDEDGERSRRDRPAQRESAVIARLAEKIADGGA